MLENAMVQKMKVHLNLLFAVFPTRIFPMFPTFPPGKDLEPYFSEPSNESLALDASEKLLAMYIAYCKKRSFQDVFLGLMAKQMVDMYI